VTHVIGVIGGSGLYEFDGLEDVREERIDTPFGAPSDAFVRGRLDDVELVFLPRHGRRHHLLPTEVPYRANVWALKAAGCGWVVSIGAVGSLREHLEPGHAVVVDQAIDRTRGRASTFFGDGVVAHAGFADPTCATLRRYLLTGCTAAGVTAHDGGVYLCMEGPAFSTRAESHLYRSWGADVIGMTMLPEAKLAREASLSYAALAFVTDHDAWHTAHEAVTVDQVIEVLKANVGRARHALAETVPLVAAHRGPPPMHDAMRTAFLTPLHAIGPEARRRLGPLLASYGG
jgi:5'-methylthioadenosine phosphorylase